MARISEIVTQTLRFYREPSKPTLVHISEIVDSALILYQARLSYAEIVVERDFGECSPIVAMAGELRQVILNLIGNASTLDQGGRLKIRVSKAREHRNGRVAGSSDRGGHRIRDPSEIRKTLFEPFVSTKGDTGTGLGLWMSSEIVQQTRRKDSGEKQRLSQTSGTVFSVFLPLNQIGGHLTLAEVSTILDGKSKVGSV